MAESYGFLNKGSNDGRTMGEEDFDEEDVWGIVKTDTISKFKKSEDSSASRVAPIANISAHEVKVLQQSSPVNIPDCSKIYSRSSKKGSCSCSNGFKAGSVSDDSDAYGNVDDGDDDVPPHEWIAKKLARSQISSFSVCEGVGRTLKGRDLTSEQGEECCPCSNWVLRVSLHHH